MGGKFPYSPCRKRAYTKGFLFLCCIIQQSQVSACSFTWFSTLLPRRKDQEKYLSCIVFITFWTSLLASSLGLIFDWAKPFEEIGLKTNSYKWKLTPEPRESLRKILISIFLRITIFLTLLSHKHFSQRGCLGRNCRSFTLSHIFFHRKRWHGSIAFLCHFVTNLQAFPTNQ